MTLPPGFIPPYPPLVRGVEDGEAVQADVANRAATTLTQRDDHLKARLDALSPGDRLLMLDAPLDDDVLVGNLVFRNTEDNVFSKALAAIGDVPDANTGIIEVADSSYSWGVVLTREATSGSILLGGILDTSELGDDLANLIEDAAVAGVYASGAYFLSSVTAGKCTRAPKIAGLFQMFLGEDGVARLLPAQHGILEAHIHYTLDMVASPAGEANCVVDVDDTHEIIDPDSNLPGWLPADDAIFGTAAPVGAYFGYNITKDSTLAGLWPPTPVTGSFLMLNGQIVPPSNIIIDNSGIWWMRNDFGNVPWPVDECGEGSSSSADPLTDVELTLFITEFVTKTGNQMVTRLRLEEDEQNIQLLNEDGTPNTTGLGSLRIALALNFVSTGEDESGYLVVQEIGTNFFKRGPIVSQVVAGPTGRIIVTNLDAGAPAGKGRIQVDIAPEPPSPEEQNLYVVPASPSTGVTVQTGSIWVQDGNRYVDVPTAVNTGAVFTPATSGNVHYDIIAQRVDPATLAASVVIVTGDEVVAPGDPYTDAKWSTVVGGDKPLAIIKIDDAAVVDIIEADITNLKSVNFAPSQALVSELRKDGLGADGLPNVSGSLKPTAAVFKIAPAQASRPANVDNSVPLQDVGAGGPGTALVYSRTDHFHKTNVDAVNPAPLGVAAPGVAATYAKRDHVHPLIGLGVIPRIIMGSVAAKTVVLNELKIALADLSDTIEVTRAAPLTLSFDSVVAAVNTIGGVVISGAGGDVPTQEMWYAIYALKHSVHGIGIIASPYYENFDNIQPTVYGATTYAKQAPNMPRDVVDWTGAAYRYIGDAYLLATGDIRWFQQCNDEVFSRDQQSQYAIGGLGGLYPTIPVGANYALDMRIQCPPGASEVLAKVVLSAGAGTSVRVFSEYYDPGTPAEVIDTGSYFRSIVNQQTLVAFTKKLSDAYLDAALVPIGATSEGCWLTLDDPETRVVIVRRDHGLATAVIGGPTILAPMYKVPRIMQP